MTNATYTARVIANQIVHAVESGDCPSAPHIFSTPDGSYRHPFTRYLVPFAGLDGMPGGIASVTIDTDPSEDDSDMSDCEIFFAGDLAIDDQARDYAAELAVTVREILTGF